MKHFKSKKFTVFILILVLLIWQSTAFGGAFGLKPGSGVAVFDSFGNNFQDFNIDPDVTVFSDSNNGGLVLSQRPSPELIDAGYNASPLKGIHPRILATKEDFRRISANVKKDEKLNEFYVSVISNADSLLEQEPLIWELRDGVRLWFVSQDFIDRMLILGMAYQLTGDTAYAKRGYVEMNAIALFDNWHPEHHIDVGGLAVGYAIGYDWLYDYYTAEQRQKLERAANRLCFSLYADGLQSRSSDMRGGILAENNHNAVMNSGGIMMASAFYDVNPSLSSYLISSLIRATEYTVDNFMPDGSWYEGISYGTMTIEYYSLELATLHKIFGSMYGLDEVEGTSEAAQFIMNFQCPTSSFSYGDGGQGKFYDPGILYFLDYFGYGSENFESSIYAKTTDLSKIALSLLWYKGESEVKKPRDNEVFYEKNDVITARNSWDSMVPTFVGMKGARPRDAHGHMDVGTFAFYSDGIQWTYDPGAEGYNVSNYWDDSDKNDGRWLYYRMRAEAHNCIVVNPGYDGGYEPNARGEFVRFEKNDSSVIAVLDMKASHGADKVDSAERGYFFTDNRQSFVVRDEITPVRNGRIAWFMSTKQKAEIINGKVYLSDSSGKKLKIEFASDANYEISITDAVPLEGISPTPEGNSENKNVKRIVVMIESKAYEPLSFTAKLTPESTIDPSSISNYNIPLKSWKLTEVESVVKISSPVNIGKLPSGTEIVVDVSSYGSSPTDYAKLFEVSENGVMTEVSISINNRCITKTANEDKRLVAVLYNASGTEIARSEEFSLKPDVPKTSKVIWDVDFEDETLNYNRNQVIVCDKNGVPLTDSEGHMLSANRNAQKCIIDLRASDIGSNGQSMYFKSAKSAEANDQAQINNFDVRVTDGVVVLEMDYLFKDFNTYKTVMGLNCQSDENTPFWAFYLTLGKDGNFSFGGEKYPCTLNTWHNVKMIYDIDSKTALCIIDGKYMGCVMHEETVLRTTRFSFQLACTADTEAFADNFKVTHLVY